MGNWLKANQKLIGLMILAVMAIGGMLGVGATWVQSVGLLSADAVVFASDAPSIDRFMARAMENIYGDRIGVCDGTADEAQINTAIAAIVTAGGGKVKLSCGEFQIDSSVLITQVGGYSYLTLEGQGQGTILKTTSIADHMIKGNEETARHMYVTLRDFIVNGDGQAANGTTDSSGIKLFGASYSRVYDVTAMNCYKHGLWIASGAAPDYDSVDYVIRGCKLNSNGADGLLCADTATDVTVVDCNIYYNTSIGIDFQGGGCIATANRIYENVGDNIKTNGMWTQIVGNNLAGDYRGVECGPIADNSIISGNIIKQHSEQGIYVDSGVDNLTITGNFFADNVGWMGHICSDSDTALIRDNDGYIGRGESRTYAVTLTAGSQNTTTYFQNPFPQAVWVTEARVQLTTAASAGNPVYDMAVDADGSGLPDGAALFTDIPDTAATYWSCSNAYGGDASGVQAGYVTLGSNASTSDWIGFAITTDNGTGLVATAYITLMGQ
jgi:hypothetical protein